MENKKLNVTIPEDAIRIIDSMTDEVQFTKKDTKTFIMCVNTLTDFIAHKRETDKESIARIDQLEKQLEVLKSNGKVKEPIKK